jgi:hypothetical protein
VGVGRCQDGGDYIFTGDPWPDDGGEKASGVIVEPVNDLHAAAVC